jgi:hypothetical protein
MITIEAQIQDSAITAEVSFPVLITGTGICADSTVKNSDSSYLQTVSSGATLTLPSEQWTVNVNGELNQTFTAPSLSALTINIQ